MSEAEIAEAIAQQEEHIRRSTSCSGVLGKSHAWRAFGNPATRKPYSACVACLVTETPADYAIRGEKGQQ